MRIRLSDHFDYGRLLRYTVPSMIMMVFTSIYNIVDGFFVSNFAGKEAFAAVNIIFPVFMIIGSVGFMLGSGGAAIVAQTLGEGHKERADQYFSMLILLTFIIGIVSTVFFELIMRPLAGWLGASGTLQDYCVTYGRQATLTMPFFMLQTSFQTYFNVAEKPRLGLLVTVASGLANIVLDFLLVGVAGGGLVGAAVATNISELIGGAVPVVYFIRKNSSLLRLVRARFTGRVILKACTNGSSEMLSNMSSSIVSILYNNRLLNLAGADGVAAYGAIMYLSFIFAAILLGYAQGTAPIMSYHYGAENKDEMKNVFRRSLVLIGIFDVAMTVLAIALTPMFTEIFVGYDESLQLMTQHGMRLFSIGFLFFGYTIYASSFFTSLGDGLVSAIISFVRSLALPVIMLLILPLFLGLDGIWLSETFTEAVSLAVSVFFWIRMRAKYGYA